MSSMPIVKLENVSKVYDPTGLAFTALSNINLQITAGDFIAIIGASGSGKSTLIHILGLLDHPTTGVYYLDGEDTSLMDENKLSKIRNLKIGFVFQSFNLLPRTSALDNVSLPLLYAGVGIEQRQQRAKQALESVGLKDKISSHPNQLSGGQQQRVAIARALVNNPQIILADEPTGNLDSKSGEEVMQIFTSLNKSGKTIVMITHEADIAKYAKQKIRIKDGQLQSYGP